MASGLSKKLSCSLLAACFVEHSRPLPSNMPSLFHTVYILCSYLAFCNSAERGTKKKLEDISSSIAAAPLRAICGI